MAENPVWLRTWLPVTSLHLPQRIGKDSAAPGNFSFLLYSLPKSLLIFRKCLALMFYIWKA